MVCKLDDGKQTVPLFKKIGMFGMSRSFVPGRDVAQDFIMPPGRYCFVPSTFNQNKFSRFILEIYASKTVRYFQEGDAMPNIMDEPDEGDVPDVADRIPEPQVKEMHHEDHGRALQSLQRLVAELLTQVATHNSVLDKVEAYINTHNK